MRVYKVYTDERSDRPFSDSLLKEVVLIAENETDALKKVLKRYSDSFHCEDEDLRVEIIEGDILIASY